MAGSVGINRNKLRACVVSLHVTLHHAVHDSSHSEELMSNVTTDLYLEISVADEDVIPQTLFTVVNLTELTRQT